MSKEFEDEMKSNLKELRDAHDAGHEEAKKQIADALVAGEEKHVKEMAELKLQADKAEELEKKIADLEADVKRGNFAGDPAKIKAEEEAKNEIKGFHKYLEVGAASFGNCAEAKYLRTDNSTEGGYLCPAEYSRDIDKNITEFSDIRKFANVSTISAKSIELPKRTARSNAFWVGEGENLTESNSEYGLDELKAEKMASYTDVTFEMMSDSVFDVKSEITSDIGEGFGELEGTAFHSGDGIKKPLGYMTNTDVAEYSSGNATGINPDTLWGIQGELKKGYDASWMFNMRTLYQHLAIMKGGDGQYLFQIGQANLPNTFAGRTYGIDPNMADVSAGTFPIILADWKRFYKIVDGQVVSVIEDNFTQATAGKKRFLFYRRTGGQIRTVEAAIKLKIEV
jgi:HK97 family phage major capsid protein